MIGIQIKHVITQHFHCGRKIFTHLKYSLLFEPSEHHNDDFGYGFVAKGYKIERELKVGKETMRLPVLLKIKKIQSNKSFQ